MKSFIILSSLFSICWLIACNSEKPISTTSRNYIRRNAHSPEAQADLTALAQGVKAMKSLECTNNQSWYYWGAMHHVPELKEMGGYDTLCLPYNDPNFKKPDAWDNCPHMKPAEQQLHFLVWHRLYTWYFERNIRKFSGKQDFALPYWNYNNANQRTIPAAFRQPAGYDVNPIWEGNRSRWLMAGNAIVSNDKDSIAVNVDGKVKNVFADPMGIILDTTLLWDINNFALFSVVTEDMPHNCMHDYIGGAVNKNDLTPPIYNRIYQKLDTSIRGLMADVPSAGFDPIFFMHHANIDRLWMAWELDHPDDALTLDEFSEAGMWTYNFIDENGKEIRYTSLQQIYDSIRSINYTYDYLANRKPKVSTVKKGRWNTANVLATTAPVRVLKTPDDQFSINLTQALTAPKDDNVNVSLEVEVSLAGPSDNIIVAMLDVNDDIPVKPDITKHIAGVAGLFGLQKHEGGGHDMHAGHDDGRIHKTMRFDITGEIARQNGFDKSGLTIYLHQLKPEAKNPVYIEKITIKEATRK